MQRMKTLFSVYEPISIPIYPILIWTVLLLQNICIWVRIIYLMYFIRNLTRLLVLTLHPCALIRQRSFLKEPTGEWILLQKKLNFPAAPTFINNSKKNNRYYSAAIPVWIKFLLSIEQKTLSYRVHVLRWLMLPFHYVKPHHSTAR